MKRAQWMFLSLFFSGATAAHAAASGKLAGTATDQEGQPITQAIIRLVDVISGKALLSTAMRPDASYAFESVPEGVYYLAAQVSGYKPFVSRTVAVKDGETTLLDLVFQSERSWVSGVFTTAAALWSLFASLILALWGPRLYSHIHRPKLALDIREHPPFSHWINPQFPEIKEGVTAGVGTAIDNNIDIYFCRVKVSNRGKTEAEKVEVTVRRVFKQHEGWVPIDRFVPLNLRWSNTWDIVRAGEDAPGDARILVMDRISAGGERLCDLGFVVDPDRYQDFCQRAKLRDRPVAAAAASQDPKVRFVLAFEFIRDLERHRFVPGRYLLEVVVDAIRIRPKSFWIELQIPDTVTVPRNEKDRKQDLLDFHAQCHEKRPPGIRALSPGASLRARGE